MLSSATTNDLLTINVGIMHSSRYFESQSATSLLEAVTTRAACVTLPGAQLKEDYPWQSRYRRRRSADEPALASQTVTMVSMVHTTAGAGTGPEANDTDLRLITLLEQDPRVSVLELAARLGCSRTAAKHRLDRLIEQGTVRVVGLADDGLLGRSVIALLKMSVSRPPGSIAASLLEHAEVTWVATTFAVTTVLAQVAFPDNFSLSQFVDRSVRSLPGVERVFVDVVVAVLNLKRIDGEQNNAWMTSDRSRPAPDDVDRSIIEQLRRDGRTPFAKLAEVSGLPRPPQGSGRCG